VNDTNLAKLSILDAYIALLDAVVHCSHVKALSALSKQLEPITHELNALMLTMYTEPFKTALKRTKSKGASVSLVPKRNAPKRALKRK
jgi:hypothetical protein